MPSTFYDMRRMARGKQLGRDELLLRRIFPSFHPFNPNRRGEAHPYRATGAIGLMGPERPNAKR
jgi:hypothetical protein